MPGGSRGFTLIELLVVCGVLALLLSLLVTGLRGTRETARQGVCLVNLRQTGLLTELIAEEQRGLLPFWLANTPASPTLGRMDQQSVYGPHSTRWDNFLCPADREGKEADWQTGAYTSYEYWPGIWMNQEAEDGAADPIGSITALFRREAKSTILYDRGRWHPNNRRNGVHLPDLHAKVMGN